MVVFKNIDLLSVGVAVAAIGILGFVVFLSNRKSITNRTFLFLSLAIVFWSIINYSAYQFYSPFVTLWLLRLLMFFATWFAFFIFQFLYVFPYEKINFSLNYKLFFVPLATLTSIISLTPLVFSKILEFSSTGGASKIANGPGMILFGVMVMSFNISGIVILIKKMAKAIGSEKTQLKYILTGLFITLSLIVVFNFILPAFFDNPSYIPLGALFIFPFVAFTSYAILRHGFLGIKVIATEILTFVLAVVVLYEVIFAEDLVVRILRIGVFLLVLAFGILLIRSVRREVQQRERLQKLSEDLSAANTKLQTADRIKSEFLSFASHQVKSPMAVVKGYAQLIYDGTLGQVPDKVKETATKIKVSADRLIALVNNLLDLRKIEEGKMDFKFGEIDIVAFVRGMAEEYKGIAEKKGLEVTFLSKLPSINIKADEEKLRQVIQNLVDNSIKYTEPRSTSSGQGGFVKMSVVDEGTKSILVKIEDSGRGMSQDLIQKLFQQFVRDEKTKKEIQGTGLGLYIAKQIVNAHNGQIWAESEGEGKGSRFFVRLSKK